MDRRTVIADAAIDIIAANGLRALTHRALDAAVGLPAGSTSYYFRTRADLLAGVSQRLVELSRAVHLETIDGDVASSITRYLLDVLQNRMHHLRARYALALDPGVDAETRERLARSFFSVQRAEVLFHDHVHAEGLVSLCEGLLIDGMFGRRTSNGFEELRSPIVAYLAGAQSDPMNPDS